MKELISRKQQGGKLVLPNDATRVNTQIEEIKYTKDIRQDLSDLSEQEFQQKYGTNKSSTSKHKYKQDNFPEYAAYSKKVGKENAAINGSIDYVDSDVRSKNFGGHSNMFFLTPNQQGTPLAKELQEQTGDIISSVLPLPSLKLLKKILPSAEKVKEIIPNFNILDKSLSLRFKANPEMGYRALGVEGFEDILQSGVIRAKQAPPNLTKGKINLSRGTNRNPNTGKLQGSLDRPYFADGFVDTRYGDKYIVEANKELNNLTPIDTHLGISIPNPGSIPLENVNVYKKD